MKVFITYYVSLSQIWNDLPCPMYKHLILCNKDIKSYHSDSVTFYTFFFDPYTAVQAVVVFSGTHLLKTHI